MSNWNEKFPLEDSGSNKAATASYKDPDFEPPQTVFSDKGPDSEPQTVSLDKGRDLEPPQNVSSDKGPESEPQTVPSDKGPDFEPPQSKVKLIIIQKMKKVKLFLAFIHLETCMV